MIRALRGAVLDLWDGEVILDVGGVGYQVFVPRSAVGALPAPGGEVALYIHTHVREDAIHLYGFPTQAELRMFETLIGVGGIGPKLGLTIMSHLAPDEIVRAVLAGEGRPFTKVPGIGKKTAARMLLELKDKMKGMDRLESERPAARTADAPGAATAHVRGDAIAALLALGFADDDATEAVAEAAAAMEGDPEDVQLLIKSALKRLDRLG